MYRGTWELAAEARHHIAELAAEHRACSGIELARLVRRLRRSLGMGLIQAGEALAGHDRGRGLPPPSGRPEAWNAGS